MYMIPDDQIVSQWALIQRYRIYRLELAQSRPGSRHAEYFRAKLRGMKKILKRRGIDINKI